VKGEWEKDPSTCRPTKRGHRSPEKRKNKDKIHRETQYNDLSKRDEKKGEHPVQKHSMNENQGWKSKYKVDPRQAGRKELIVAGRYA